MKRVCKFIQKLIDRRRMRKEAKLAHYAALCNEPKDNFGSWERDILRERSWKTRQTWIMAALDGDSEKQEWLAGAIECGVMKL